MIIKNGQGVRAQRLSSCSRRGARRSSPSTLSSAWRHLLQQQSCAVLAHAVMASSATCWAVAPAPGALHPAEKSARCARAEAPRLWFVVGRRHDHTMVWMAADACVPRRNAARWMLARSCVMSRYSRDYAQRVRACTNEVCRTLSKQVANNSLQRE